MIKNDDVLLTDIYQLTMLQAYHAEDMNDIAVFEFFVRELPKTRNFFIAAGLEQLLDYVENLHFSKDDLNFLKKDQRFSASFIKSLKNFKFTGDIYAMPEGTIFFPNEPILQVIAPLPQAQLIESRLINILHFQTIIASKAIRSVLVAPDKLLVDFGMRRAHGAEAAVMSSRASYLAGFSGTATTLSGKLFNIPLYGTMAHSYIQAHGSEKIAFSTFARTLPGHVTLLIDTYDTEQGALRVTQIAPSLRDEGIKIDAVRLDSGDFGKHAVMVRRLLDEAGLHDIKIFASGNMDEVKIQGLIEKNYPIDGFGLGSALDTSSDVPYLNCAYKLQEYAGQARRKRSEGKSTWPGRKQVYRFHDEAGQMDYDLVTLKGEEINKAKPLLEPVMIYGKRVEGLFDLEHARKHLQKQLAHLPMQFKQLTKTKHAYPVVISQSLQDLAKAVDQATQLIE